jgi:hypothetical protein
MLYLGAGCGWVVNAMPWPLYIRQRVPSLFVEQAVEAGLKKYGKGKISQIMY